MLPVEAAALDRNSSASNGLADGSAALAAQASVSLPRPPPEEFLESLPAGEYDSNHVLTAWTTGDRDHLDEMLRANSLGIPNLQQVRNAWRASGLRAAELNPIIRARHRFLLSAAPGALGAPRSATQVSQSAVPVAAENGSLSAPLEDRVDMSVSLSAENDAASPAVRQSVEEA